jgi:signal transduction histidine kinase
VLLISIPPVLVNHAAHLPPAPLSNMEGMVLRQLPVLFIALTLIAWHFNLETIIIFSLGTNALDLLLSMALAPPSSPPLNVFFFITVIRTVCFIVVGVFINRLVSRLRGQQEALALSHTRLAHYASTLENLTVSRERNRMSRELHDTVVHTLSGLSVQLETLKAYWKVQPDTALKLVEQALAATRSGLQETRRALKALRASPLEDLGLVLAIREMAESAAARSSIHLDLSLPERDVQLSPDVEQCIYRVAQEATVNVVQHANAQQMSVKLETTGTFVELRVVDDGIGFNPEWSKSTGHYGLAGMQERAELAGGELAITSAPGRGTTVDLNIPTDASRRSAP